MSKKRGDFISLRLIVEACARDLAYSTNPDEVIGYAAMAAGVGRHELKMLLQRILPAKLYADH